MFDAISGYLAVARVKIDSNPLPPERPGGYARCPSAIEHVEHDVPFEIRAGAFFERVHHYQPLRKNNREGRRVASRPLHVLRVYGPDLHREVPPLLLRQFARLLRFFGNGGRRAAFHIHIY